MAKTSSHAGEDLEHHAMSHGHGEVGGLDVVYGGDHLGIVVSLGLGLRNLMRAMHVCIYIVYIIFYGKKAGIL